MRSSPDSQPVAFRFIRHCLPRPLITASLVLGLATGASAYNDEAVAPPAVELGAPFGDHAVLQRGAEVPVWGWCDPGTQVTVGFAGQTKTATAGQDGKWMVRLDAMQASAEPRQMTIQEKGGDSRVLEDLLVGEVWLASGQSNMQWQVGKSSAKLIADKLMEQAAANGGKLAPIREFAVTNYFSSLHPIEHAAGDWKTDYQQFSAIAFAFAHKLHQELDVPIGILNCSFSQTSIEAWTPRTAFEDSKSEYNQGIHRKLLETDPATPEHQQAWSAFYDHIMKVVGRNQQLAADGDDQFHDLPVNNRPGNMGDNRDAAWMFNARLNPVVPYAISGAIWNQGYANMGGGITYYDNLHAMIRGWRACWGDPELPVYFHQFYSPGNDVNTGPNHPDIGGTAEMRLGTWLARDIPHTGMASQIDIQGAIHYGNKSVPGQRLALHALKNQYGRQDVVADGPMFRKYEVKGDKLIIDFDNADGGLVVATTEYNTNRKNEDATGFADPKVIDGGDDQVRLFYLAGEDRVWHPAKVKIEGGKAVVTSDAVKNPRGVSYGTGGIGFQPNLYNQALLPTTPFIVYDNEMVTSKTWPDSPIRIAGVEADPSTVGLLHDYRSMPLLSTQFRDHAVLQADQPVTIWGGAVHPWSHYQEQVTGAQVIHFRFGDIEKTIPVVDGMKQWSVTLPPMEATAKGRTLKVSLTVDGKPAHERVVEDVVFGDVWYVAGLGDQKLEQNVDGPVRVMTRMAKGVRHSAPRPYSVATSTQPKNRFASYWGTPTGGGFAESLANAIHKKTGRPVGIIYMDEANLELKHWMDVPSLAEAPSLKVDYEDLAAVTPGTPYYKKNAERFIDAWKQHWSEYIPEMIATKRVPDGTPWGRFPTFAGTVETDATQVYNCMVASFRRTQLKGIVFMTGKSMVEKGEGGDFAGEMTALANGWKRIFSSGKDPMFIYTIPAKDLTAKITKPDGIKGGSAAFEIGAWPQQDNRGAYPAGSQETMKSLVDFIIKEAY